MNELSILVIKTPNYCGKCPLCQRYFDDFDYDGYSEQMLMCVKLEREVGVLTKPRDCPLHLMPKKRKSEYPYEGKGSKFSQGWNACLDAILKGDGE